MVDMPLSTSFKDGAKENVSSFSFAPILKMEEKKFIITESQIEEINHYLKRHSFSSVKAILKQLPIHKEEKQEKLTNENENKRSS